MAGRFQLQPPTRLLRYRRLDIRHPPLGSTASSSPRRFDWMFDHSWRTAWFSAVGFRSSGLRTAAAHMPVCFLKGGSSMTQSFTEYIGQLAQADSISFKLIDGDGQILFAPFYLGDDFIVGYTATGET